MTHAIKVTKGINGWKAESAHKLGDVAATEHEAAGARTIELTTLKRHSGNVVSIASVHIERLSERGYITKTMEVFGDYSRTVRTTKIARITEKSITEAHKAALEYFDDCIAGAKLRYECKEA